MEPERGSTGGAAGGTWPTEATAEPLDDAESVLSRGNGRESCPETVGLADGAFRFERDGIRFATAGVGVEKPLLTL